MLEERRNEEIICEIYNKRNERKIRNEGSEDKDLNEKIGK